jgi:hypothetical protein
MLTGQWGRLVPPPPTHTHKTVRPQSVNIERMLYFYSIYSAKNCKRTFSKISNESGITFRYNFIFIARNTPKKFDENQ